TQQHEIASKFLSGAEGRVINGQEIFEQSAKLRKCEGSGLRRIPPLGTRKGRIPVGEAKPPWLLQADRKGRRRLCAVAPADEKIFGDFVKPAEQRHPGKQHSVGVDV